MTRGANQLETQQSDRRFCGCVVALFAAGAMVVASLNLCVNPYAQYATRFIEPLVETSRTQKVAMLGQLETPPSGLVLGSSRVMKLEPEQLQTRTGIEFFNGGMNYARIEDILAFLRYYEVCYRKSPEILIVGLDVFGFSEAPVDARLLSQPQLGNCVPEVCGLAGRYRRWQELLSWQQTVASLKSLKRYVSTHAPESTVVESFAPDGLKIYHQREAEIAAGQYDFQSALAYNRREYKHLMAGYRRLSPQRQALFEELVAHCRERNIELAVFLTPLHPDLASYLTHSTTYEQRRDDLIAFLTQQSQREHFTFTDLSDVTSFAGEPELFIDGIHPLEANTRKMIDRVWNEMRKQTEYVIQ